MTKLLNYVFYSQISAYFSVVQGILIPVKDPGC